MADSISPVSGGSSTSWTQGISNEMGAAPPDGSNLMNLVEGNSADLSNISSEGMAEISKQQSETQKKIQEMVKRLQELMKAGKYQEAGELMNQIQSVAANAASAGTLGQMSSSDKTESKSPEGYQGNTTGIYGDGPALYTTSGGGYNYGGTGSVDTTGVSATLSGEGNQGVVGTALQIGGQGLPYVWGGDGGSEGGYDCSGFTHAVYGKNGINIPRTAQTQFDYCKSQGTLFTDQSSAKPGDLIFFNNPYDKKTTPVGHVMIYLGDGKMVGAQSDGVKVYDTASMSKYIVGYGRPE
ncbi:MAG: NlpC/P60 family protein [Chloroflexi bacterium]|nr:NlpC/P60 family protein [Chloroflexota bacterium]